MASAPFLSIKVKKSAVACALFVCGGGARGLLHHQADIILKLRQIILFKSYLLFKTSALQSQLEIMQQFAWL